MKRILFGLIGSLLLLSATAQNNSPIQAINQNIVYRINGATQNLIIGRDTTIRPRDSAYAFIALKQTGDSLALFAFDSSVSKRWRRISGNVGGGTGAGEIGTLGFDVNTGVLSLAGSSESSTIGLDGRYLRNSDTAEMLDPYKWWNNIPTLNDVLAAGNVAADKSIQLTTTDNGGGPFMLMRYLSGTGGELSVRKTSGAALNIQQGYIYNTYPATSTNYHLYFPGAVASNRTVTFPNSDGYLVNSATINGGNIAADAFGNLNLGSDFTKNTGWTPNAIISANGSGVLSPASNFTWDGTNLTIGNAGFGGTNGLLINGGRGALYASGTGWQFVVGSTYPYDASKTYRFTNGNTDYLQIGSYDDGLAGNHFFDLKAGVDLIINRLAGTGTRVVTATNTGKVQALANGTNGHVLTLSGGVPAWVAPAASGASLTLQQVLDNGKTATVNTSSPTAGIELTQNGGGDGILLRAQGTDGGGGLTVYNNINAGEANNNGIYVQNGANALTGILINNGAGTTSTGLKINSFGNANGFVFNDGNQAEGRVLTSDVNGRARWAAPTGGGGNFNATITSPATGQYVRYNGSAWVNANIASGDLPGTIASNTSGTASNITATSNSTLTTLSALSLPFTQTTGTVPVNRGGTGATTAADARTSLGLGNVDNTSDLNKPISTATTAALNTLIKTLTPLPDSSALEIVWYNNTKDTFSLSISKDSIKAGAAFGINGLVKSNGLTLSQAIAGTDYQTPLVSGTDIKTISINGGAPTSLLGAGNIDIASSGGTSLNGEGYVFQTGTTTTYVDNVVQTSGDQTISGTKTFSGTTNLGGGLQTGGSSALGNLWVPHALNSGNTTSSHYIFGGATNTHLRVGIGAGNGNVTPTTTRNYATVIIPTSQVTTATGGTHSVFASQVIKPLGITSGGTLGAAASLYVEGPATGTGIPSNNYSLWVDDGVSRFDGKITQSVAPATYSGGGYDVIVRNQTSGDYETTNISGGTTFDGNGYIKMNGTVIGYNPTIPANDIEPLPASKITSGTFDVGRVATGTATEGYVISSIGGVPTWTEPATGGSTFDLTDRHRTRITFGSQNPQVEGAIATTTSAGTVVVGLPSNGAVANQIYKTVRTIYRTANTANAVAELRPTGVPFQPGQSKTKIRFGTEHYFANEILFIGWSNSTATVGATVESSTLTNIIGVGKDSADVNYFVMYNDGSGTATKVDTGIPAGTNAQLVLNLEWEGTTYPTVTITNLETGVSFSHEVNTNINTAVRYAFFAHVSNNSNAGWASIAMINLNGEISY